MIPSAFRKFALNLGLDAEIEREVAAAGFPGASFVRRLRAVASSGAFILASQEVNLHFDCVAVDDDGAMKGERLPRVYIHKGRKDYLAVLEELVTGAVCRAIVPSGYREHKGELWYARVHPPPLPGGSENVIFTTPYIVLQPGPQDWLAYFSRTLPQPETVDDYERHMKYGPTRKHWSDFNFETYVNCRTEAISLAGLPDVPESRPHSR